MTKLIRSIRPARAVSMLALTLALVGPTLPASAQDTLAETRLRKMEAEIRALQRKVFPGDDKFFAPEITQQDTGKPVTGQPATTAVTDILSRLDSIEAQVARLTGQIEQNSNRIAQLEARANAGGVAEAPSGAVPAAANTAPAPAAPPTPTPVATPAAQTNLDAMTGGASAIKPAKSTKPVASGPTAARLEAVKAIVKPQTDDVGDDEYSYGYRLWDAKFYPEAEQQLNLFVDKYPSHWRISYGRNLLGRAYLDDGNPREAAKWFLQNYQADKNGTRASDSLLYLGIAMKQLKDTKRACIALAEFSQTYATDAAGRLKSLYDSTRDGLKCN